MAQTPESKVKAKVVKLIKAHGIYYFFPATYGFGRSGVPDVVCCAKGKFIAIECKAGNNKPTALQEKEMADIRKAGGHAYVVNEESLTLLGATLRSLLDEGDIDGRC